jgi:hypothetical protein
VSGRALRGSTTGMTTDVARHQWEEGLRRLAAERGARARQLADLVDAVQDELRRRVGQTFTLAQLAAAYGGSEDWVRDVVVDSTQPRAQAGVRDTALVQDAAFGNYARGATDYRP